MKTMAEQFYIPFFKLKDKNAVWRRGICNGTATTTRIRQASRARILLSEPTE
jgi:hypothetical protein